MYKAIIFDVDGTLIRTPIPYIKEVLEKTLDKIGIKRKVNTKESGRFWYKEGRDEFIIKKFGVKNLDEFWGKFIETDSPKSRENVISIYDDVHILEKLKEEYDLKFGILSNAHPGITKIELDFIGGNLFDIIINSSLYNGIKPKPHTEGVYKILKEFDIKNSEVLLVGDSEADILCAKKARVTSVLIERWEHYVKIDADKRIPKLVYLDGILEDVY